MAHERVTGREPVAGDDLQHPRRQELLRQLDEAKRRQRRLLGRLQDLDVAGRERRPELPDRHHQRVVPRCDPGDDPEWLAPDDRGVALDVLARSLALERPCGAGEEAQVVGRERHLVARDRHRLADVLRLELGQLLGVVVDHVGELQQQLHPILRRLVGPLGERLAGGLDGALDVLRARPRHLGDHLARRRVEDLHRLAGRRVDPLAADEVLVLGHGHAHRAALRSGKSRREPSSHSTGWTSSKASELRRFDTVSIRAPGILASEDIAVRQRVGHRAG